MLEPDFSPHLVEQLRAYPYTHLFRTEETTSAIH